MNRVIILGSGAASGIPIIAYGWGDCNPNNPKNRRSRAGVYVEIGDSKILIDTSADLRNQLIDNDIQTIDAVLYTHAHADHIMGIDDLRALNYNTCDLFSGKKDVKSLSLNVYGAQSHIDEIYYRFDYAFIDIPAKEETHRPRLFTNVIEYGKAFTISNVKIMPLEFSGHSVSTTGYVFNEGQVVLIPDYKVIPPQTLDYLKKIDVNVLIMPLTVLAPSLYHADIDINLDYVRQIKPRRVWFTHLGPECDYDEVMRLTPENVAPAYDGLEIKL